LLDQERFALVNHEEVWLYCLALEKVERFCENQEVVSKGGSVVEMEVVSC